MNNQSQLKKGQYTGKKSMLSKCTVLPATTSNRKEFTNTTSPKISELVIEART